MASGSVALVVVLLVSTLCSSSRKLDLSLIQLNSMNSKSASDSSSLHFAFDPSESKRLSWHPRVFLYEGFLSDEECDHLVSMARGKIESSLVVDGGSGNSSQNNIDARSRMYLADSKDAIISKIEERISLWSFLPREYGEDMQILQYGVNESYGSNVDYFEDKPQLGTASNRLATVLIYLSDVKQGGETVFPRSELKDGLNVQELVMQ